MRKIRTLMGILLLAMVATVGAPQAFGNNGAVETPGITVTCDGAVETPGLTLTGSGAVETPGIIQVLLDLTVWLI